MIFLKRTDEPKLFSSSKMKNEIMKITEYYNQDANLKLGAKFKPKYQLYVPIKKLLLEAFNYKCAFCEKKILNQNLAKVERFRPSINAMNLNGKIHEEHYWWLRYDWSNLYLICRECNRNKNNLFPIKKKRADPLTVGKELLKEQPLLLDPCFDRPEEHFFFDFNSGLIISNTERGRITIDVYGLNREDLLKNRVDEIAEFSSEFSSFLRKVRHIKDGKSFTVSDDFYIKIWEKKFLHVFEESNGQFLLMKRQYILSIISKKRKWLDLLFYKEEWSKIVNLFDNIPNEGMITKELRKYNNYLLKGDNYDLNKKSKLQLYFRKSLYIEKIEIRNFKAISELKIEIPPAKESGAPWLLLLGENSTGKSSVLKAIALTLMGNENRKKMEGLDARSYLKKGCKSGYVKIHLTGRKEPVELFFDKENIGFKGTIEDPPVLLLGYGATRILSENLKLAGNEREVNAARCENLFNPIFSLVDAELWLAKLSNKKFKDAAQAIKRLFAVEDTYRFYRRKNNGRREIISTMFGTKNTLNELSHGYQSVVALACDIMMVLQNIWEDSEYAQGIVLLDELDVHLHPRWKMQIVSKLKQAFPRIQFISTTHEPLVLRGLNEEEVMVLKRDKKHRVYHLRNLPSPGGLRVDQILTSPYFGLNSTLDPETERLFERYYFLLSENVLTQEEKRELTNINIELKDLKLMGDTPRDQLMYSIIDEFLAREKEIINKGEVDKLKEETVQRVVDIITSIDIEGE
ncbi:AAA family ATPase [Bacillus thuringiensis]|nr:AAA family ATPase [Bacillus thuringiensis]